MSNVLPLRALAPLAAPGAMLRRATLCALFDDGSAEVALTDGQRVSATWAAGEAASVDDAVLVVMAEGELFVIAVVRAPSRGVVLRCEEDAATGRQVVRLPDGAVEVQAVGELTWSAAGALRVESAERVTFGAGADAATDATVVVDPDRVRVKAPAVDVDASAIEVAARRASVAMEAVSITADVVRRTLGTLETDVDQVVERARTTLRETADLALTRAGRLRTMVERTASFLADRVVVKSEHDVKIDGQRIHLG